jgi:two-component system sensor histidine kinase KdpD
MVARDGPRLVRIGLFVGAALGSTTLLVAFLEGPPLAIPDASSVYLFAVAAVAAVYGSWAAAAAAVVAFVLYDVLFVHPRFTLAVDDPREWLNLLLLLFVGVAIGRLTAVQARRADEASRRAREAQALFRVSRTLATAGRVADGLDEVVRDLRTETGTERIWVTRLVDLGERVAADSGSGALPQIPIQQVLTRTPGDQPARWVRAHQPGVDGSPTTATNVTTTATTMTTTATSAATASIRPTGAGRGLQLYRVNIEADGARIGALWATRGREAGNPTREETRLLALAADQVGLAYRREDLAARANAAEVGRRSDALRGALLDSVSHDLRTPLASIRATAGSLVDDEMGWTDEERVAAARSIDREAERLAAIVRNLLDLSRIQAGALTADVELFDLGEAVASVVARVRPVPGSSVEVAVPDDLPPVWIDEVFLDVALANLLENAGRYAAGMAIRITGTVEGDGHVALTVEDAGRGVAADELERLFDRFYRVPRSDEGARRGLGIGLAVVKGLVEAMGGTVAARRSELGGLAVTIVLRSGPPPEPEGAA